MRTVRFLSAHGFGDPREGEYRTATIPGSYRADRGAAAHGWLKKDGTFVTWKGQVVKPISVGPKIYLDWEKTGGAGQSAVALLLLAGETRAAEKVWWRQGSTGDKAGSGLVQDFLTGWFDQAAQAHLVGRDADAAWSASRLRDQLPAYRAFRIPGYALHGFVPPFLDWIPRLDEDARRRLAERRAPANLESIAKLPRGKRIAALIDALDEVRPLYGVGMRVAAANLPIVQQLVDEGVAAVPAILDCMEKDRRLTRELYVGSRLYPIRELTPVSTVAKAAFCEIYELKNPARPDGSPWTPGDYRAYHKSNQGRTPVEARYAALCDDHAGARAWDEALEYLTARKPRRDATEPASLRGDVLRAKRNPSVSDLARRRVRELSVEGAAKGDSRAFVDAMQLALRMRRWEPVVAEELLQLSTREFARHASRNGSQGFRAYGVALAWRLRDANSFQVEIAMEEWAEAVTQARLWDDLNAFEGALFPILQNLEREGVRRTIRRLFKGPFSFPSVGVRPFVRMASLGALRIDAYRESLIPLLADRTVIGHARGSRDYIESLDEVWEDGFHPYEEGERDVPALGEERSIRVCDAAAVAVQGERSLPRFRIYWSERAKDAAIAAIRERLAAWPAGGPELSSELPERLP